MLKRVQGKGLTVLEIACALAVVIVVTVAVIGSLVSTFKIHDEARAHLEVENAAAVQMEEFLAKPFADLTVGVSGPFAVGDCVTTVCVYTVDPGGDLVPPVYGIEVNARNSQNARLATVLVTTRTRHEL